MFVEELEAVREIVILLVVNTNLSNCLVLRYLDFVLKRVFSSINEITLSSITHNSVESSMIIAFSVIVPSESLQLVVVVRL